MSVSSLDDCAGSLMGNLARLPRQIVNGKHCVTTPVAAMCHDGRCIDIDKVELTPAKLWCTAPGADDLPDATEQTVRIVGLRRYVEILVTEVAAFDHRTDQLLG